MQIVADLDHARASARPVAAGHSIRELACVLLHGIVQYDVRHTGQIAIRKKALEPATR